jgi:hypothetical protein
MSAVVLFMFHKKKPEDTLKIMRALWKSKNKMDKTKTDDTRKHIPWRCMYFTSLRFLCHLTTFFSTCWSRGTSESSTYGKQWITLRKWCYTRLQHDFPLDPMISSFHIHFGTFVTWLRENYDYHNVSCHGRWFAYKQTNKYFYC